MEETVKSADHGGGAVRISSRPTTLHSADQMSEHTEVLFPGAESAEWLNQIFSQMWPYIENVVETTLKTVVEPDLNRQLPSIVTPFKFQRIDFGSDPPRIEGVKVHTDDTRRNEVVVDLAIVYAGDAHLRVSFTGLSAGITDVKLKGVVRVEMRPLIGRIPIVAALTISFLELPELEFDLKALANFFDFWGISTMFRSAILAELAERVVAPNKITVSLTDHPLPSLLFDMPKGVLQLVVEKAKELKDSDIFLAGTSDPYCRITVGSRVEQTPRVKETTAPVWNKVYQFVITEEVEDAKLEVYDKDTITGDDCLGRYTIDFDHLKSVPGIDGWYGLDDARTGQIKLCANWKQFNNNPLSLSQAKRENEAASFGEQLSVAILLVFVDSANQLPLRTRSQKEPDPYVVLQLGIESHETREKESSTSPVWEEQFALLCDDPTQLELNISVMDKGSGELLGTCKIPLSQLMECNDMMSSEPYELNESGTDSTITLHLCLRILTGVSTSVSRTAVKRALSSTSDSEQRHRKK